MGFTWLATAICIGEVYPGSKIASVSMLIDVIIVNVSAVVGDNEGTYEGREVEVGDALGCFVTEGEAEGAIVG